MRHPLHILLISLFVLCFQHISSATIRYVKPVATGSGDGSSWVNASSGLQAMINVSASGDEVWVAAGTYKPLGYPTVCSGCMTNQDFAFSLKDGVKVYGGFAGTEILLTQRNLTTNPTILSGDLMGNDGPNFANNSDNATHVVIIAFTDVMPTTRLDGFTISGGNANGTNVIFVNAQVIHPRFGGGVYNANGTNILANNTISGNSASIYGGGISINYFSNTTLMNNIITSNLATCGGGVSIGGSVSGPENCKIINNIISGNSGLIGGIVVFSGNNTYTNNTISGNMGMMGFAGGFHKQGRGSDSLKNNII